MLVHKMGKARILKSVLQGFRVAGFIPVVISASTCLHCQTLSPKS